MHTIVEEHDIVSGPNSSQEESSFTSLGNSQDLYRVFVPPTHVFVHRVQSPQEQQSLFSKRK